VPNPFFEVLYNQTHIMEQTRLQFLLEQYAANNATEQEKKELWDYIQSQGDSRLFEEAGYSLLEKETGTLNLPDAYSDILRNIVSIDRPGELVNVPGFKAPGARVFRLRSWRWVAAAAVLLVLAAGAFWLITDQKYTGPVPVVQHTTPITPGRAGAILTLANGSQVLLDTIRNGAIALQGGAMAKVVDGSLIYEASGDEVVYNTTTTPKGRQYQLTLPDGSVVWLNAFSSVRYPTVFVGKERRVTVTGEAYFEVAKDKSRPFFVEVDGGETVKVLGTHFNLNAYRDEPQITTTLLEGVVNITATSRAEGEAAFAPLTLHPGQQAVASCVNSGDNRIAGEIRVLDDADTLQVLAWKNGLFNFEGVYLKTAMKQIARWYDVDVVYSGNVPDIKFFGSISRSISLAGLIKGLQSTGIHISIGNGRQLIVKP
jgi:ferric-dicitrate binding protein FerR (iron transport regulator)